MTALHTAAISGHVHVARALVDAGASLNARDAKGRTPAQLAARRGHLELSQLLGGYGDGRGANRKLPCCTGAGATGERCDSKILVALRFCSIFYINAKGAVRTYESGRHSTRWRGATQHRGKWIQGGVCCRRSMALSRTAHTTRSARTTPLQVADVMAHASGGFRPWRCRRPWTPAWGPSHP